MVLDPSPLGFHALLRPVSQYAPLLGAAPRADGDGGLGSLAEANVALARSGRWRVNFVAFLRTDCELSAWGAWTACGASCLGSAGGRVGPQPPQARVRSVRKASFGGGKACPGAAERAQSRPCQLPRCAVDCVVGAWGAWERCNAPCGGVGARHRVRAMRVAPVGDGMPCPPRVSTRDCRRPSCGRAAALRAAAAASTAAATATAPAAADEARQQSHLVAHAVAQVVVDVRVRGPAAEQLAAPRTSAGAQRQLAVALARTFGVPPPSLSVALQARSDGVVRARVRMLLESRSAGAAVAARVGGAAAAALLGADFVTLVAPPRTLPYLSPRVREAQQRRSQQEQERTTLLRQIAVAVGTAALAAAALVAWRARSAAAPCGVHSAAKQGIARSEAVPLRRPVRTQDAGAVPAATNLQAALAAGVEAAARREFKRYEEDSAGL